MTDIDNATQSTGTAAQVQSANALIVQSYALSVQAQPNVDLSAAAGLVQYQTDINKYLGAAKDNARTYLNVVLPHAIETISDIDAYFQTQNALAEALAPGTDVQLALALLGAVQDQATDFRGKAVAVTQEIQDVRDGFSRNSADLGKSAQDLAVAVDGDNGVLASISGQLSDIDGKMAGAITGVVVSGFAVAGGIIMIGIGALAEAVTGGLATALIVGGLAVTAAGIGGEVGASIALAKLVELKSDLLRQQAALQAETTLAAGLSSGLGSLASSAAGAATAAQGMANAWSLLGNDLGTLITDLSKGRTTVDAYRLLFGTAAKGAVKTVQGDVTIIRNQLAGVQTKVDPGVSVTELARRQLAVAQGH